MCYLCCEVQIEGSEFRILHQFFSRMSFDTLFSVFFYIDVSDSCIHSRDSTKLSLWSHLHLHCSFLYLWPQTTQLFFCSIPFTIQRLCELLTDPRRNYTGTDKFLRGVEKVCILLQELKWNLIGPRKDNDELFHDYLLISKGRNKAQKVPGNHYFEESCCSIIFLSV